MSKPIPGSEVAVGHFISANNFSAFVAKCFGLDSFEIIDTPNDVQYRVDIRNTGSFCFYEDEVKACIANGYIEARGFPGLHSLLELMVRAGHIERGIYVIDVTW